MAIAPHLIIEVVDKALESDNKNIFGWLPQLDQTASRGKSVSWTWHFGTGGVQNSHVDLSYCKVYLDYLERFYASIEKGKDTTYLVINKSIQSSISSNLPVDSSSTFAVNENFKRHYSVLCD